MPSISTPEAPFSVADPALWNEVPQRSHPADLSKGPESLALHLAFDEDD